jgi:hypothetical protein
MHTKDDYRDDEHDWPEDVPRPSASEPPSEPPEVADDAGYRPHHSLPRRRHPQRRRGAYRPPSELDRD